MSTFDKRDKYALDEEQKFKAEARHNRMLGMWVAERLGMTGDAATAYAKEVVASDFEEAGDGDVVRKVLGDLTAKGIAMTEQQLRAKKDELMETAVMQVKAAMDQTRWYAGMVQILHESGAYVKFTQAGAELFAW